MSPPYAIYNMNWELIKIVKELPSKITNNRYDTRTKYITEEEAKRLKLETRLVLRKNK